MSNDFWPKDTKDSFYHAGYSASLASILEDAQERWPGIKMDEIEIDPEYIQTSCIGYDQYDSTDYTNFLKITASADYFKRIQAEKATAQT